MGKASSSKKVARAARAGGGPIRRQRASLGYPAFISLVVILGIVGVVFSRNQGLASASTAPRANRDHWHAALGFDVCGAFAPSLPQAATDPQGIHTHGDGIIHLHPFVPAPAGKHATLAKYLELSGVTVTETEIKLPDGTRKRKGDKCEGKA